MKKTINSRYLFLIFFITTLVFFWIVCRSMTAIQESDLFFNFILLDLTFTFPFLYYLIIRKTNVPKISIISIAIIGLLAAGFILPTEHQDILSLVKTFLLPVLEIGVVTYIVSKARAIHKLRKSSTEKLDFYDGILFASKIIFPQKLASILSTEIAVIYYLFQWKPRISDPDSEFTYYKKSGIRSVMYAFLGLGTIETIVVHMVLSKSFPTLSWILFGISIYSCLQIFALLKSLSYRPIMVNLKNRTIKLRYGFFAQAIISIDNIERIEETRRSIPDHSEIIQFSPLGFLDSHNLIIHLKHPIKYHGFYGKNIEAKSLALFIDEKSDFINKINKSKDI